MALIFFIGLTPIQARITVSRKDENDRIEVDLRALWGWIRFRYIIPFIQFRGLLQGTILESKTEDPKQNRTLSKKRKTVKLINGVNGRRKRKKKAGSFAVFSRWLVKTLKSVQCDKFEWKTEIGSKDAAVTAFATGLLWAIKSSLVGWCTAFIRFQHPPLISVSPVYNRDRFVTAGECILKIRLGNAIIAALLLWIRILRVKGGFRSWRTIPSKAS